MEETKPVLVTINPELWKEAKIQAIRENLDLREWVAKTIRDALNNQK